MAIEAVRRHWKLALLVLAGALAAGGSAVRAASGRSARAAVVPVFGKSVDVVPVSGEVLVRRPGQPSLPLRTESQIPVRSVIDTRAGTVRVTSARAPGGSTRTGTFAGGQFRVLQGSGGVTQLRLVGEDFSDCAKATAAKRHRPRRYRAYAVAEMGFVVIARDVNSTPKTGTATWQVSDECDGTRTTPKAGAIALTTPARRRTLLPGSTAIDFCHPPTAAPDYCLRVDSDQLNDNFSFGVLRRGKPVPYQLCVSRRGRGGSCARYSMTYIPRIGSSVGVVECDNTLSSGTFLARWRIRSHPLGVPLTFTSIGLRGTSRGFCYNYPLPRFGQSVAAIRVHGTVSVSSPGNHGSERILTSRAVSVGSVIDARHGAVALTVQTSRVGGTAAGTFSGAQFRVDQPGGRQGLAVVRLVGGSFATCATAAPDTTVRQLLSTNQAVFGTAGYIPTGAGFRVVGRYSSAVGHGRTTWSTEDACDGTHIRPIKGEPISVSDAFQSSTVNSGEDELDSCSSSDPNPTYCLHVLSEPARETWGFGVGLARGVKQYNLCIRGPNGANPCYGAPMTSDGHGHGVGNVTCSLNQGPGEYAVGWFLGTHELGAPLRFIATQPIVPQLPAINCVLGTPVDSHASRSVPMRPSASRRPVSTEALRRP